MPLIFLEAAVSFQNLEYVDSLFLDDCIFNHELTNLFKRGISLWFNHCSLFFHYPFSFNPTCDKRIRDQSILTFWDFGPISTLMIAHTFWGEKSSTFQIFGSFIIVMGIFDIEYCKVALKPNLNARSEHKKWNFFLQEIPETCIQRKS